MHPAIKSARHHLVARICTDPDHLYRVDVCRDCIDVALQQAYDAGFRDGKNDVPTDPADRRDASHLTALLVDTANELQTLLNDHA